MSQQMAQNAFIDSVSEKLESVLLYARTLPISLWRNLVLALAFLWATHSAASLFWLVFPLPELEQPSKLAAPIEVGVKQSSAAVSFDSLVGLKDVFGSSAPVIVTKPVEQAPVIDEATVTTKLRLKLHGVFSSNDPTKGSAIVADGNQQALYSVGDEIEGNRGVKLARVMQKRVVLDNKGKMESLWLFSEEDFEQVAAARSASPTGVRRAPPVAPPADRGPSPDVALAPDRSVQTTARVDQIPKNIGDVVRFSVHREGGQMVGYRIRPGRDRELFNQVGLKANDIVTSVNGIEVNDPKQIRSVYKSMKTATEAQLTVLRDGETHSITISLDTGA